jgi:hypothetical protein
MGQLLRLVLGILASAPERACRSMASIDSLQLTIRHGATFPKSDYEAMAKLA